MVGSGTRRSTRLVAKLQQSTSVSHESPCVPTKKRKLSIGPSASDSNSSSFGGLDEQDDADLESMVGASTQGSRKQKENAGEDDFSVPTSPRKKRVPKPEPVYVIPGVTRKETTFRGRLGEPFATPLFLSY